MGSTPAAPVDRSTQLAEQRTHLAEQRTDYAALRSYFAAERTLMAWIRTALSMISFGFTMVKVFEYLDQERKLPPAWFGQARSPSMLGLVLISLGTLALMVATVQHQQVLRELHRQGLAKRWSLALTVATLLALVGAYAFGSLVVRY